MKKRDHRFPPSRRVQKRREFLRIQTQGRKVRSRHLLLLYERVQHERGDGQLRIGITVTKKVDKRAARRNRFKRRVREFFRRVKVDLREGHDLVVIALDGACTLDYWDIREELCGLFDRARLFRN